MSATNTVHPFSQLFRQMAEKYTVPDFVTTKTKRLFILESPHIEELKNGVPVAGNSGKTMSKIIFQATYNEPLGLLVKKNAEESLNNNLLDTIGLLNVCPIPLQLAAYTNKHVVEMYGPFDWSKYAGFMAIAEKVRINNNQDQYSNANWNVIQQLILDHFKTRLSYLVDRPLVIIPCGRFAQKFFRLANIKSNAWTVIDGVPHPSYNSWEKQTYNHVIEKMLGHFK